jgi:hypothetical protein
VHVSGPQQRQRQRSPEQPLQEEASAPAPNLESVQVLRDGNCLCSSMAVASNGAALSERAEAAAAAAAANNHGDDEYTTNVVGGGWACGQWAPARIFGPGRRVPTIRHRDLTREDRVASVTAAGCISATFRVVPC